MKHNFQLVSIHKMSFRPIPALCSKNNPRNIKHIPADIFFACRDLEQKSSFMDGHLITNEEGSVMVLVVIFLMLLTILGIAVLTSSRIDTQLAANEIQHKLAFCAAESAAAYVKCRPDLYGPDNITAGTPHYFPNSKFPYVGITSDLPTALSINATQSFNGEVEYDGSLLPPRGAGYSVGKLKAHHYQMVCKGYSIKRTTKSIVVGFYRIGY